MTISTSKHPKIQPPTLPHPSELLEDDEEGEEDIELKHDVELIGAERPSSMAQPRQPEIDPRISISQFLYVTEKLLGEDPHP